MQRILSRGEIEDLDHTLIPRLRLPQGTSVFADRAARLRTLAADSPLQAYLQLMVHLTEAQHHVMKQGLAVPEPDESRIGLAQAHGMPPLQAIGWRRDPVWREMLRGIVSRMPAAQGIAAAVADVCRELVRQIEHEPDVVEEQADALLANLDNVDYATAPFIMAGLQVYWTAMAARFDIGKLPVVTPFGVCPVCGALPVSSIVRVGPQIDGCRYLGCSLCSSEWHLVRVTCSHCQDTEKISFHSIEGDSEAVKAESCGKCGSYRKIFYQYKDPHVDAVADDLASLTLDIMMGEEGYSRASGNPLLWQKKES